MSSSTGSTECSGSADKAPPKPSLERRRQGVGHGRSRRARGQAEDGRIATRGEACPLPPNSSIRIREEFSERGSRFFHPQLRLMVRLLHNASAGATQVSPIGDWSISQNRAILLPSFACARIFAQRFLWRYLLGRF
jgi:hypothetical protein